MLCYNTHHTHLHHDRNLRYEVHRVQHRVLQLGLPHHLGGHTRPSLARLGVRLVYRPELPLQDATSPCGSRVGAPRARGRRRSQRLVEGHRHSTSSAYLAELATHAVLGREVALELDVVLLHLLNTRAASHSATAGERAVCAPQRPEPAGSSNQLAHPLCVDTAAWCHHHQARHAASLPTRPAHPNADACVCADAPPSLSASPTATKAHRRPPARRNSTPSSLKHAAASCASSRWYLAW